MRRLHQLVCIVAILTLFNFAVVGCGTESSGHYSIPANSNIDAVGFDFDDTLMYSSPAFERGFNRSKQPFSPGFWKIVNSSDAEHSCIKPAVEKILEKHRDAGHEIYVITAREPHGGDTWKAFVSETFSIPDNHAFLEPDGKTGRLRKLGIDLYYGDSDSDITDAQDAGITPIRIQRNPESNYQKKYNPGKFGEKIVDNTAEHDCSL